MALAGGFFEERKQEVQARLQYPPDRTVMAAVEPPEIQVPPSRWSLKRVRAAFPWLQGYTLSGVWRLLQRLKLRLRQGQPQQYSPDPAYAAKEKRLLRTMQQVAKRPEEVLLFVDEFTYRHWPLPGRQWAPIDAPPPQAERAQAPEKKGRLVGGLDTLSGRVLYRQATAIQQHTFLGFLRQVNRAYPQAAVIHLVIDNWATHFATKVLRALKQELTRLHYIRLPTYAPWLNPIEKLWGWLKEYLLRMHPLAGHWPDVHTAVAGFLDSFADGSQSLLHRVGLSGEGKLAQALIT